MTRTRILIADDHRMFRTGIATLLKKEEAFEIVGEANDGAEAIRLSIKLRPDVILMDIHLPRVNGIAASKAIIAEFPDAKILALSSFAEDEYVLSMVKVGALGYILKEAPVEELIIAIKALSKGNSYFAKQVSPKLFARIGQADAHANSDQDSSKKSITEREFEVLKFIAEEMTNKEIAGKLFISPRTVETHRRNLIQKLKVKNTAGLVKYYLRILEKQKNGIHS